MTAEPSTYERSGLAAWEAAEARRARRTLGLAVALSVAALGGIALLVNAVSGSAPRTGPGAGGVAQVALVTTPAPPSRAASANEPAAAPEAVSSALADAPADADLSHAPAQAEAAPDAAVRPLTPPRRRAERAGRSSASAPPGWAGAAEADIGPVAAAYRDSLETHIARFRRYPDAARRARVQGTVRITFEMDRAGAVIDVRIAATSGHPLLDAEALDTVRRAVPLPAIPRGLPDRLEVVLPIEFSLWAHSG